MLFCCVMRQATRDESERIYRLVYETRVAALGVTHPDTSHTLSGLVPVLVANGKAESAHSLLIKQVQASGGGGGTLELRAVPAILSLVAHLIQTDALKQAETLIVEAIGSIRHALEIGVSRAVLDPAVTMDVYWRYSQLLQERGNIQKAEARAELLLQCSCGGAC